MNTFDVQSTLTRVKIRMMSAQLVLLVFTLRRIVASIRNGSREASQKGSTWATASSKIPINLTLISSSTIFYQAEMILTRGLLQVINIKIALVRTAWAQTASAHSNTIKVSVMELKLVITHAYQILTLIFKTWAVDWLAEVLSVIEPSLIDDHLCPIVSCRGRAPLVFKRCRVVLQWRTETTLVGVLLRNLTAALIQRARSIRTEASNTAKLSSRWLSLKRRGKILRMWSSRRGSPISTNPKTTTNTWRFCVERQIWLRRRRLRSKASYRRLTRMLSSETFTIFRCVETKALKTSLIRRMRLLSMTRQCLWRIRANVRNITACYDSTLGRRKRPDRCSSALMANSTSRSIVLTQIRIASSTF